MGGGILKWNTPDNFKDLDTIVFVIAERNYAAFFSDMGDLVACDDWCRPVLFPVYHQCSV